MDKLVRDLQKNGTDSVLCDVLTMLVGIGVSIMSGYTGEFILMLIGALIGAAFLALSGVGLYNLFWKGNV